jgi:hypothetical protein
MTKIGSKNSLSPHRHFTEHLGRARKITTGEQFKPRIFKSFNPTTQELYRDKHLQQFNHQTQHQTNTESLIGWGAAQSRRVLMCEANRNRPSNPPGRALKCSLASCSTGDFFCSELKGRPSQKMRTASHVRRLQNQIFQSRDELTHRPINTIARTKVRCAARGRSKTNWRPKTSRRGSEVEPRDECLREQQEDRTRPVHKLTEDTKKNGATGLNHRWKNRIRKRAGRCAPEGN